MVSEKQHLKRIVKRVPLNSYTYLYLSVILIVLGSAMNITAVIDNGGKMPIWAGGGFSWEGEKHFTISPSNIGEIKHLPLIDMFPLFGVIWSLGDFLLLAGAFSIIMSTVSYYKDRRQLKREVKKWKESS